MNDIRWGILATGGIAHMFTSDLRTAGLDVAAVGSRSQASADAFAHEFEIPAAHGSYEALVADPDVDIVYVASPHGFHAEHAALALEAGKHVLVEKAFTLTQPQAAALRDLAAANKLLLMEAMWTRYVPNMIRIRELIRSGTLGQVRAVIADHTQALPTDPTHRLNSLELGGGALLDLGVYPVSFAHDILGAPETITATGRLGSTGADTEVVVTMTHADGAISTSISSARTAGPNEAHILGTEARIDLDPVWYTATTFRLVGRHGEVIESYDAPVAGRGMQYEALAAEQYLREGRTSSELEPIDETVAIMGTLDEIRRQIGVRYPGVDR
ncbi:Gfo/Idh/MocA family protein [Acidipropionibacterium virtanenii]|uniref:1,5-anhydro-D-fructose reductase n=1 Tax=Acidipropionibacterium virtanenii TaxID=2057246 RepID=A0A344UXU1_9ACTN|nr:Gfo/Idh/MocA family oxidoreductase [Acidipropionibacterium virtanenii]AXE40089.1 1,5-anhydro-D-fructose reductase [Acidipropionibacterium virtanenii]